MNHFNRAISTCKRLESRVALVSLLTLASWASADASDCPVGAYRLHDRHIVDIAPSEGNTLRWRALDGTTGALSKREDSWISTYGWTGRPDGKKVRFSDCKSGGVDFDGQQGRRIQFQTTDTRFLSHDVSLVGRLVLPRGHDVVPIIVLIHGSEHDAARDFNALQRILPAQGVGAFVYDKRGTGGSGGEYTQDFSLLADDAVAAVAEARRLAGHRGGRVGYQGGSQAGWVIPIAANRQHVDFAIVGYGLAVSVIDEDRQEVAIEMREKGHSAGEIADALEVAGAAETVIASGFTQGFKEFDAARSKFKDASWYKDLHGNYTYALLPYSETELRDMSAKFRWGTPFYYDPMPTLRSNTTPQLWILGTEDYAAPSADTSQRIKSLIREHQPFTLALYPGAEHGMTLFEVSPESGERLSTRYAPGYFAMIRDFAREGRLRHGYGDADVTPSPTRASLAHRPR